MSEQINRKDCFICGKGNSDVLERHHIVPRRFGGSDNGENLVDLCPTCHRAVETLYDSRFYDELGVKKPNTNPVEGQCEMLECTADATIKLSGNGGELRVCGGHNQCGFDNCELQAVNTISTNGVPAPICDSHRVCSKRGCKSCDTKIYRVDAAFITDNKAFCDRHGENAKMLGEEFAEEW